jgi:predicted hydrolase (HD superfamily)
MNISDRQQLQNILYEHVIDPYQRFHALMVATAMEGYASKYGEDLDLWFATGYLHDLDFDQHPDEHPGPSLGWFADWGLPNELIHAVEAHADGYNGFTTKPETLLAKALLSCDEICGIFYAYQKVNPVPFGEMKVKSIKKRLKEVGFAPKIDREHIYKNCELLDITIEEHIENLIKFLGSLSPEANK